MNLRMGFIVEVIALGVGVDDDRGTEVSDFRL